MYAQMILVGVSNINKEIFYLIIWLLILSLNSIDRGL